MQGKAYRPPENGYRTFLIAWATQSISVIGSALTLFALNIWLAQTLYARPEQKPQLAWALSAMSLCFALPAVLGAPLAGAWADRHDRRRTMIAMDFASTALTFVTALLVIQAKLDLASLLVIITLSSCFGTFHAAAFDTSYAMLVPEAKLPRANDMIWQTQTSLELQGRVFSVRRLIAQCTWPLSVALAGWLGGAFDPGAVISELGLVLLLFSIAQVFNRRLLQVEDKAALDAMAARAVSSGA